MTREQQFIVTLRDLIMTKLRSKRVKQLLSLNDDVSAASRIIKSVLVISILGSLSYHFTNIVKDYIFRKPPELHVTLRDYGYTGIVPPSTFHGPGTFNTVERRSDGTVTLHPTCDIDAAILSKLWQRSETIDRNLREVLTGKVKITNGLLENFKSQVKGEQIRDVYLSLRNANIFLLSHESLLKLQKRYIKDTCEEAIVHNIKNGSRVCQTEAVLQADFEYTIVYDNVDSAEQEVLTEEVSAYLATSGQQHGKNEFKGEGLFFGARLLSKCLSLDESYHAQNKRPF